MWITFLWWISLQTQGVTDEDILAISVFWFSIEISILSKTSALLGDWQKCILNLHVFKDFPDSSAVQTSPSIPGGTGLILVLGAKISHALLPKDQNIKQKQYWNIFNKDFKNGPHQKNLKKINLHVFNCVGISMQLKYPFTSCIYVRLDQYTC